MTQVIQDGSIIMRYQHDCSCCKPLGQYMEFDIYYCDATDNAVITRYGDRSDEYVSGIQLGGASSAIGVAIAMAKAAGYIDD